MSPIPITAPNIVQLIDPCRLHQPAVEWYREARTESADIARRVATRMDRNPKPAPFPFEAIAETHGIAIARARSVLYHNGDNVGGPLSSLPRDIEHHAKCALNEKLLVYGEEGRHAGWKGWQVQHVHDFYRRLPTSLRERLDAVFMLLAREIDPSGMYASAFARWEESYERALEEVGANCDRASGTLPPGAGRRIARNQRFALYGETLDAYRDALLPWFDSLFAYTCGRSRDH